MFRFLIIAIAVTAAAGSSFAQSAQNAPAKACVYANKNYSDGAVMCNGTRIKLTCSAGKWTPEEKDSVVVCGGAPFSQ